MKKINLKVLFIFYIVLLITFVFYSYTQIDLNLTLSSNPLYQFIQQKLIFLGYYRRGLSAAIFLMFLLLLFLLQLKFIRSANNKQINKEQVIKLSLISALILIFAYPAFSHDIFNYIFDARMVIYHKVNPLTHTALDFPDDLWTRFMRWTHRTYPYGPVWLLITLPFYLFGLGKFVLTLFWFKILGALSYLSSVFFLLKILEKTNKENIVRGLVIFSLSPLVLIESLVSAHIDITMTAFLLLSIHFMLKSKNKIPTYLNLFISASIKFVSIVLLPVFIWWNGHKEKYKKAIYAMIMIIFLALLFVVLRRELLPWYYIIIISLIALIPNDKKLLAINIGISFGLLLRYFPFLLKGEYSDWVKQIRNVLTIIPILLSFLIVSYLKRTESIKK